jgi:hypothetical protein
MVAQNGGIWYWGHEARLEGCSVGCGGVTSPVALSDRHRAAATLFGAVMEALQHCLDVFRGKSQCHKFATDLAKRIELMRLNHMLPAGRQMVLSHSHEIPAHGHLDPSDPTDPSETSQEAGSLSVIPVTSAAADARGAAALSLAPMAATPVVAATPSPAGWSAVRQYVDMAEKFTRCQLACQVMAGFELNELHKVLGIRHGKRTDLTSPIVGEVNLKPLSWPDLVKREAGISEQTSRNWMAMATAVKPRLKKLKGSDRLRALLQQHPSEWTKDDTELMRAAVHKITDGKTQTDFLEELGLAKKPQGSGAVGGYHPSGAQPQGPEAQLEAAKLQAIKDWGSIDEDILRYAAKFCLLTDPQIEAQIVILKAALEARQTWLKAPDAERDPQAVKATFVKMSAL